MADTRCHTTSASQRREAKAYIETAAPDELEKVLLALWRLQEATRAFFSEFDNPSKDYLLLRARREQLREALSDEQQDVKP